MREIKTCIVVVMLCAMMLVPNVALAETYNVTGRDSVDVTLQIEAKATNVAPSIDDTSFVIKITAEEEVYPVGYRADATIPFAFTGEDIEFAIDVTDDNGEEDIANAITIFISEDESVDDSDISLSTEAVESTKDGDVRLTLTKLWNVPSSEYGKKNILVTATDSGGLSADNNGLKVGEVFINPQVGFEITNSAGEDIGSIQFPEGAPGTTNVSALNSIQIRNIDPDGVGMRVRASVQGEDLGNQNVTGSIPIANMNANGLLLSTELQKIDESLAPAESNTHAFSLDYPLPLPAGNYVGAVTFEIEAL
ncbi:hypothetical protein C5S35_06185 [Candidatus Methanophagaceae archaeon]|nr:hypothetical protein C5S35_06185 [Methanophagales archaeon]